MTNDDGHLSKRGGFVAWEKASAEAWEPQQADTDCGAGGLP